MAESLAARGRRVANTLLHPLGLHLTRRERAFEMDDLLAQAAARGCGIKTWIDVGASDGIWTLRARKHFPKANYILVEPLAERREALQQLEQRFGFKHIAAAAGPVAGKIAFQIDSDLDGSGAVSSDSAGHRQVPQTTIDAIARESGWPGPYGIKLDTHGYEVPILDGAGDTLTSTGLLIIEAYNFNLTSASVRFPQLCALLESRGFRCAGMADPMLRPNDGMLWQMDLAFLPQADPAFASNHYHS